MREDVLLGGSGTSFRPGRARTGSLDSAAAPNLTAPVESVLVFYRFSCMGVGCKATASLFGSEKSAGPIVCSGVTPLP